jgi:hypothetical protein
MTNHKNLWFSGYSGSEDANTTIVLEYTGDFTHLRAEFDTRQHQLTLYFATQTSATLDADHFQHQIKDELAIIDSIREVLENPTSYCH